MLYTFFTKYSRFIKYSKYEWLSKSPIHFVKIIINFTKYLDVKFSEDLVCPYHINLWLYQQKRKHLCALSTNLSKIVCQKSERLDERKWPLVHYAMFTIIILTFGLK